MDKYLACILAIFTLAMTCSCQVKVDEKTVINRNGETFSDCKAARKAGYTKSGVYKLHMKTNVSKEEFHIYCEHTANNSFNVIQRRQDGSYTFNLPMSYYKNGFGSAVGEYWAGLDAIYHLTVIGNTRMDIQLRDWNGRTQNVQYKHFSLSPAPYYSLNVMGYSGNIPDDMSYSNGQKFSTYDNPDPYNCAVNQKSGWWYNYCAYALLNGQYYMYGPYTPSGGFYNGIYWKDWQGYGYSLQYTQMMIS